jgi:tRNA (cmo5U34)-methyltransferase
MSASQKDNVFDFHGKAIEDFKFDKKVAGVFDDMVSRSVPFYDEMQRMAAELAGDFAADGTNICDIGCSTGTSIIAMDKMVQHPYVTFQGYDNAQEMLNRADEKLKEAKLDHPFNLNLCDLNKGIVVENASVVTMLLTLQFIRPLYRERLVKQIYDGLNDNGAFIIIEKLTSEDTIFNRLFIQHYYEFKKRNGYSELEISNKREALENVLIPYRMEENFDLLKGAGFRAVEIFFRWYNFCGIIALK